jgi:hypothetical protein
MEAEVSEINANNLWGQVYAVSYVFSSFDSVAATAADIYF